MRLRGRRDEAKAQADTMAALRVAALRAIARLDHPDGPRADINPHTPGVSAYALASMLTFDFRGDQVGEDLSRVVHMIAAGKPERREARRDWLAWELGRLGHDDAARAVAALDFAGDGASPPPGGFPLS
jgi:hypothetical protein